MSGTQSNAPHELPSYSKAHVLAALPHLTEREQFELERLLEENQWDEIDKRCGRVNLHPKNGGFYSDPDVGCLYWLQNLTATLDDHWLAKGTAAKAPFPRKSYLPFVLGEMQRPMVHTSPHVQKLYIPKSREMMTSWLACGYIGWSCQWRPGMFYVMQTEKEDKAAQLIRYIKILWDNQSDFLKERHPLRSASNTELEWKSGSRVLAVPKGVNQIRIHHPFGYVADEAAFLPEFIQCVDAVAPVAKQIIAISSANPGTFADQCES